MSNSLFDAAYQCLIACDIDEKLALTQKVADAWQNNQLKLIETHPAKAISQAGLPKNLTLVHPRKLKQRSLHTEKGRIAFIHAIAHIEFNAINLAWDAVYRFRQMPVEYSQDWIRVASEEAYHFSLLRQRLHGLNHEYGDLPAHNGLWDMACRTDQDVLTRMALVPRVLEARGLDVTPSMIDKLQQSNDQKTADILKIILRDEITHVAIGSHWFKTFCQQQGLEPDTTFQTLLKQYFDGDLRGPFNVEARLQAGFSEAELNQLGNIKA